MRTFSTFGLALLALTTLAGAAMANLSHGNCGTSTLSVGNSVRADVWANNTCAGVIVWSPLASCTPNVDVHLVGTHTLVLYDGGCQTGELVTLP